MSTALLDVNVFIALVWPAHEHHRAAHEWRKSRGNSKWASCPLTQLALVRLLSNPAFSPDALSPDQALKVLQNNIVHPLHEFWPDSLLASRALERLISHITVHGHITDAYLLALAIRRKARVATFDRGLEQLAINAGHNTQVEVIPAR